MDSCEEARPLTNVNRSIPQVLDDETYQYVYGLGRIAQVGSADTFYYLTDGLGSTMALSDAAGDVDTTWDYDAFGAVWATSGGQPNDFTFTGEQVDGSTDLQYLRARYYDPEVGRFVSRDPLLNVTNDPYVYALNSPINQIDPLGLRPPSPTEHCELEGQNLYCTGDASEEPLCYSCEPFDPVSPKSLAKAVVNRVARICNAARPVCARLGGAAVEFADFFGFPDELADGACIPENDCYPPTVPLEYSPEPFDEIQVGLDFAPESIRGGGKE